LEVGLSDLILEIVWVNLSTFTRFLQVSAEQVGGS